MTPLMANLNTSDVVLLGSVIGGVIGTINVLIRLGDRLWGRARRAEAEMRPEQSQDCRFEHERQAETNRELKEALARLAAAQAELMTAVKVEHEAARLRHEELLRSVNT